MTATEVTHPDRRIFTIRADYFGSTSFGAIMGRSSMIVMVGSISGPIVAGVLADATGVEATPPPDPA